MTDAFTHYFLSTSLTWIALGRRRSLFLESWRRNLYFLIISLSSVVMDTDLLFDASIHRLFTHTIILPLLFLALGIVSWRLFPSYPLAYVSCFIISALTITHLLLDLDGFHPCLSSTRSSTNATRFNFSSTLISTNSHSYPSTR